MTEKEAREYMSKFFASTPPQSNEEFYAKLLEYIVNDDEGPHMLPPCSKRGRYEWDQEPSKD